MTYFRKFSMPIFTVLTLLLISCDNDDAPKVEDPPRAIFEFNVVNDDSGTVTFSNFSIGGDSYKWDFGDGSGTSTEENPTYTYTSNGKYTISLTVINEGGEASTTLDVSISKNIVVAGDMSDETAWTFKQVWNDPDNAVISDFSDGVFLWDAAEGTAYAQTYLWQEVAIEADKTYKFSADVASDGTQNIWIELYFGNVDPDTDGDYASNGLRLYISSFDSADSGCANNAFDGDFVNVAQGCTPDDSQTKILSSDGTFTLSADELTTNGTIYVVFKSGIWDSLENYKEGITLDNVSIIEVL